MGMKSKKRRAAERAAVIPPWAPGVDNYTPWITYGGHQYLSALQETLRLPREEIPSSDFESLVSHVYKANPAAFAVAMTRLSLFVQARFAFQRYRNGRPDELWSSPALDVLERPWPGAYTPALLGRAITDADHAGNFYATLRRRAIRRMRPDWVSIILGSEEDVDTIAGDLEADILGYVYHPGGRHSGRDPVVLLAREVAHWAPVPDPLASYMGMSWLTPVLREIASDSAATRHKLAFFDNGATVNLVVQSGVADPEKFKEWVKLFRDGHEGAARAYKTLFLTPGADAKVVGADFRQMDFKAVQGASETRIAAAGRIHPAIVGLSEGLQGASLNAGNFAAARRLVADGFLTPAWSGVAGALATLVPPPSGSRLWFDPRDVPFLREDRKDAAEIEQIKAATIRQLVDAGFLPKSVVAAVEAEDMALLEHSELYSVQLQPPTTATTPAAPIAPLNGTAPAEPSLAGEAS